MSKRVEPCRARSGSRGFEIWIVRVGQLLSLLERCFCLCVDSVFWCLVSLLAFSMRSWLGGLTPASLHGSTWEPCRRRSRRVREDERDEIGHVQCAWSTYGARVCGLSEVSSDSALPPSERFRPITETSSVINISPAQVPILHSSRSNG